MHITFILDDRVCAFNARVGTSIKILPLRDGLYLIQSFRTKDWDIPRLPESTAPRGGIYMFDWTILPWQGSNAHTTLTLNEGFLSWN